MKKTVKAGKKPVKAVKVGKKPQKAVKAVKAPGTSVSLVLDESGSMLDVLQPTIDSVNEYIRSLKVKGGATLFSLTKFNTTETKVVQSEVPITQALELTKENYAPDASTPLYDAVGAAIASIGTKAKGAPVLMVIVTDGKENSSEEYSREAVAKLVEEKQNAGWTFVYLGSNHDPFAAAKSIGIKPDNAVQFSKQAIPTTMRTLAEATCRFMDNPVSYRKSRDVQFFSKLEKQTIEEGTPS